MAATRTEFGRAGEQAAARALREAGYEILETRWRYRGGELDIIAREGGELVFIEVKSRRRATAGDALSAINPIKQGRLVLAAQEYMDRHALPEQPIRFDAVAVTYARGQFSVEIIRDAVGW